MAQSRFWNTWRVFWLFVREFIGWGFVAAAFYVFRYCFLYLNRGFVLEGAVYTAIAIMLFRGGLQLVKVAVAARAVRQPLVPIEATRVASRSTPANQTGVV